MVLQFRKKVRVACGSAHVRGNARKWQYFIATVFVPKTRKDGVTTYRAAGVVAGPNRSFEKTIREAKEAAAKHDADYVEGYGSLHGKICLSV